jgi:hypothetical protein
MKTDKQLETDLNNMFSEAINSPEKALEHFAYLTNKNRTKHCTENHIVKCFNNGKLGTLLKRLDYIAFSASRND